MSGFAVSCGYWLVDVFGLKTGAFKLKLFMVAGFYSYAEVSAYFTKEGTKDAAFRFNGFSSPDFA